MRVELLSATLGMMLQVLICMYVIIVRKKSDGISAVESSQCNMLISSPDRYVLHTSERTLFLNL